MPVLTVHSTTINKLAKSASLLGTSPKPYRNCAKNESRCTVHSHPTRTMCVSTSHSSATTVFPSLSTRTHCPSCFFRPLMGISVCWQLPWAETQNIFGAWRVTFIIKQGREMRPPCLGFHNHYKLLFTLFIIGCLDVSDAQFYFKDAMSSFKQKI